MDNDIRKLFEPLLIRMHQLMSIRHDWDENYELIGEPIDILKISKASLDYDSKAVVDFSSHLIDELLKICEDISATRIRLEKLSDSIEVESRSIVDYEAREVEVSKLWNETAGYAMELTSIKQLHQSLIDFTERSSVNHPSELDDENSGSILDIRQSALLFHYLAEKGIIKRLPDDRLALLVSELTGHSHNTLRTTKGFGVIHDIISDKVKNANYKAVKCYNLQSVKIALESIIELITNEISRQAKK
jgi:hypothetical protein